MITFDDGTTTRTDERKDSYGDVFRRVFGESEFSVRDEADRKSGTYRLCSVNRLCGGIWIALLKRR